MPRNGSDNLFHSNQAINFVFYFCITPSNPIRSFLCWWSLTRTFPLIYIEGRGCFVSYRGQCKILGEGMMNEGLKRESGLDFVTCHLKYEGSQNLIDRDVSRFLRIDHSRFDPNHTFWLDSRARCARGFRATVLFITIHHCTTIH